MYPDNKTVTIFDKEVFWPGLDPETGKFTNGAVKNGAVIPPSFIPAETINLLLDNFSELIKSLGREPDNHGTHQAADAVSRFTAGVTRRLNDMEAACTEAINSFTAGMTRRVNDVEAACTEAIDSFTAGVTRKLKDMEAACGYRVSAATAATDTIRIFFRAVEGSYLVNVNIATSDPRIFLKMGVTFNYATAITNLLVRDDSRIAISNYASYPEVRVETWMDSVIVLTLKLPSGSISVPRAGLVTALPALTSTFWYGTVDGTVSKKDDYPVGLRNLEVTWFGDDLPYWFGNGYGGSQTAFIGDLAFDLNDFVTEVLK
jgi:hypothetical protein